MGKNEIKIPRNQLKDFYEKQRLSIRRIAKIYSCGAVTIQRKLHRYNVSIRPSMSIKLDIPKNRLNFLYGVRKQSTTKLARIYSCSPATILNRLKEYNIAIRDCSDAHIKYPKRDFSGNLIEKAYLIGFSLGDLHVRKYEKNGKIISVECASTRPAQILLIRNLFRKYGYIRITRSDKSKVIRVQCALNATFNFLLKREDNIEPWILNNDECFFAFFAGYIDAEGDIGIYSKNTASLRVGTYGKNILFQLHGKLKDKGIKSTLNLDRPKGSKINLSKEDKYKYRNKNYKTKCDFWRIAVYKKKALLKLFRRISAYVKHPRIKNNLMKAKENIYRRNENFGYLRMK